MIKEPLKFIPILKEKIWGGEKLNKLLKKKSDKKNIGESWEISDVENEMSIVANGKLKGQSIQDVIEQYKGELVGEKVYQHFGNKFPLLIKFIDAKEALSIQLHPNDKLAKKRHNSFGKTEMWYVMQADKNANLIVGFKEKVNSETYKKHLQEKTLLKILNSELVEKGDVFFIPTGRVHAIGAGVLLAEIQQTSDVTYRIYDWDRKDDKGNYRELHTENALEALDFEVKNSYKTNYKVKANKESTIVKCPFFTTNIIIVDGEINVNHTNKDSFIIYMCVSGNVIFANNNFELELNYGETILIPNSLNHFEIKSNKKSELLEVFIE
ncbi:MAG TPA: mannose-6-phosphate isomerase [Flavobacteriaceae bacterium]|nr:mannose-6-phosphate isomerase [Flavobacteriaceae bacterium]